jgi:Fe-S cluster assembly ATP-binding protein
MIVQDSRTILEVRGLCASVNGIGILKGLDLTVKSGEVHAIMGPNGSGKSTFSKVLAGHTAYEVTGGSVLFEDKNLFDLAPEERARAGVFLAFQYPIEIPGVANSQFLRLTYNTVQAQRGKEELDPLEFDDFVREKMKLLEMSPDFPGARKSATKYCRWHCSIHAWRFSTRPIPASTSTRSGSSHRASTSSPTRITRSCW